MLETMNTYKNIKSSEFKSLLDNESNVQVIDVRTPKEYNEGHFKGSVNIPVTEKEALLSLDKNKTYLIHCRVGGRSAMAAHTLIMAGFTKVYNLNDNVENILD